MEGFLCEVGFLVGGGGVGFCSRSGESGYWIYIYIHLNVCEWIGKDWMGRNRMVRI